MKTLIRLVAVLFLAISSSAWAFMPTSGIWAVDSENTGKPGRGFNIEVQNEIVFFTYYGYRTDGSSMFYYAAGPIANNVFTSDLLEFQGGTYLGGIYQPAALIINAGPVILSFTSGTHGTITLPGESPKAISKDEFGYADGPDGLLGTWLLSYITGFGPISEVETLTTELGTSSSTGNGVVYTSSYDFSCEFQVSGILTGMVVCADQPAQQYSNAYLFKFSGDVGTGVGYWFTDPAATTLSSYYESHELRIATKTGTETGLNDGTETSLIIMSAIRKSAASTLPVADTMKAKALAASSSTGQPLSDEDAAKASAISAWVTEVRAIIPQKP
ncbi:MAG: hypothetical protein ACLQHK_02310 [Gallionellaceae bacterium]